MAEKEFKAKFTADNSDLKNKMSDVETRSQKFLGKMKALGVALIGVFAVGKIIEFGKELLKLGGEVEGVRQAFNRLNKPTLLDDLRKATRGTIDDLKLMQYAVKAENFQIPLSKLATYFEFATKRATQTGESVDYLVDSIITGIGRKSVLVMDNLGISAVALQEEVKRVGDFGLAAGNIIEKEIGKMGDVVMTNAQRVDALKASWQNVKIQLSEKLAPVFTSMLEFAVEFGAKMSGSLDRISQYAVNVANYFIDLYNNSVAFRGVVETIRMAFSATAGFIRLQVASIINTFVGLGRVVKDVFTGNWDEIRKHADEAGQAIADDYKEYGQKTADDWDRMIKNMTEKPHVQYITLKPTVESAGVPSGGSREVLEIPAKLAIDNITMPDFAKANVDELVEGIMAISRSYSAAELAAASFGEQIMAAGISGSQSMQDFGKTALMIAKKVIAAYVAEGIAAAVKSALINVPFPFNIAAAGIAGSLAAAAINAAIPEFAMGGGVSGPTLAMVGEAPGISRSNPEYIGTAKQLGQMGMGGGRLTARISRNDLLFILNEGGKSNSNNY